MKKKLSFKIHVGLSTAIAFIVIITSILITTAFYLNMKVEMRKDLREKIYSILTIGVSKIDSEAHSSLMNHSQDEDSVYNLIQKNLQIILKSSPDIGHVYTFRQIDTNTREYIVDDDENTSDSKRHFGDIRIDNDLEKFFKSSDKIFVKDDYEIDSFGTWISGYAKIDTSIGTTDGFLGMDISAEAVKQHEHVLLLKIILIQILITITCILLGIYISKKISNPLLLIEKDLNKIKDFNLDTDFFIHSRFKEIDSIQNTIVNMKKGLRSFKRYVPADLVRQLISLKSEAELGGKNKVMTVMFTDIENFTSISEKYSLDQITEFMAEYFEGLTKIIVKNKGTIDKYIGDSIMAFWGAPLDSDEHAYLACLTAVECQHYLLDMNQKFINSGKPELITRIGINSGEMIVGNFGYSERFNYTVLGDNVNLASRLEMINKYYRTNIIISESTYQIVNNCFVCRKIDIVAVKGKNIGSPIYELITKNDELTSEQKAFIELFNKGFDLYLNKNWESATDMLKKAKSMIIKNDVPSEIIIKRCNEFLKHSPADDWQGINFFSEK